MYDVPCSVKIPLDWATVPPPALFFASFLPASMKERHTISSESKPSFSSVLIAVNCDTTNHGPIHRKAPSRKAVGRRGELGRTRLRNNHSWSESWTNYLCRIWYELLYLCRQRYTGVIRKSEMGRVSYIHRELKNQDCRFAVVRAIHQCLEWKNKCLEHLPELQSKGDINGENNNQ
jgi:hypothetical protein